MNEPSSPDPYEEYQQILNQAKGHILDNNSIGKGLTKMESEINYVVDRQTTVQMVERKTVRED